MPLRHWLQLSLTEGIGPILIGRLIEAAGSAENACGMKSTQLRQIQGIGEAKASKLFSALRAAGEKVDDELSRAETAGASVICIDDSTYPTLLRSIPDPPSVLYVQGTLEARDLNGVAIVGSRKCTFYGREQAERFGALLAGAGFTVISGGARGVDSAAHRGALSHANGRTIAVLGSGVDVPYPPENDKLFDQIAAQGAVLSEFPMGTPPLAENFPRRNRIVSGMSRGVLVIEADERSGALITARQAGDDHGRQVFAIPGRIDNSQSVGPHKLIRDGAILTTGIEDIIDNLGPLPQQATESLFDEIVMETRALVTEDSSPPEPKAVSVPNLTDQQKTILETLGRDATTVDTIIERSELPAATVLQELTFLSLKGLVRRIDGQSYARR
jgi:DNA processing protein